MQRNYNFDYKILKNRPRISIITPTFNNGHLLNRLYLSIKDQTFKDFIWIVVDDGSTDKTQKIINAFNDKRIKNIKQKNLGANSARNRGEKEIPKYCKYVIFIDSDDIFFDNNSLKNMYQHISNTSSNIGAVGFTSIDSETKKSENFLIRSPIEINYIDSLKSEKFSGEFISIQKTKVLSISQWPEQVSGFESIRHWEINKYYNYILVNKPERIYFRNRKENITSPESTLARIDDMILGIEIILTKHGNSLKNYSIKRFEHLKFLKALYASLSLNPFEKNNFSVSLIKKFKTPKYFLFIIFLLFFKFAPIKIRQIIYLKFRRLSYKYVEQS